MALREHFPSAAFPVAFIYHYHHSGNPFLICNWFNGTFYILISVQFNFAFVLSGGYVQIVFMYSNVFHFGGCYPDLVQCNCMCGDYLTWNFFPTHACLWQGCFLVSFYEPIPYSKVSMFTYLWSCLPFEFLQGAQNKKILAWEHSYASLVQRYGRAVLQPQHPWHCCWLCPINTCVVLTHGTHYLW